MDGLTQAAGAALILIAFVDVYLTVLQGGPVSLLSAWLSRGVWHTFRGIGQRLGRYKNRFLAYAGPTLIPAMITMWMMLLTVGFALVFLPVMGTKIVASSGETPVGFWPALYFSLMSLVTLGSGDIVANSNTYRILDTFGAVAGFSIATAAITYLMSVYSAVIRHNSFALSLHHASDDTGDAAELLARFGAGGNFSASQPSISAMADELITIIESLTDLEPSFVPDEVIEEHKRDENAEQLWRKDYRHALQRLQEEGIASAADPGAGEDHYVELRRMWQPHIVAFADYLLYDWSEIEPRRKGVALPRSPGMA